MFVNFVIEKIVDFKMPEPTATETANPTVRFDAKSGTLTAQ